ncbi:hypothetical protein B0H14DRAFT_2615671 [Mycena olivaceomarginata]|nr:hypothetical protein B0H14DRAFT_2615671 [Mycena olivaceomarginata]
MYKHPCTNIPIKCPLDCDQFHWKYNFQQHLILSQYFLSTIHISSAEQEALGIPRDDVIGAAPPNPLKVLLRVAAGSRPHRALRIRPAAEPTRRTKGYPQSTRAHFACESVAVGDLTTGYWEPAPAVRLMANTAIAPPHSNAPTFTSTR